MEDGYAQPIVFASAGEPALALEGLLHIPDGSSPDHPSPGTVLCHPQPASADMDDPLTAKVAEALASTGVTAFRFNFRGVGASEGLPTDGRLEPLDVAGAVAYLLDQPFVDPDKLCLIGHAFGAYVALAYAAHDSRVRTVVAVSPPQARLMSSLGTFNRPKLFITGELDEVAPPHRLEPWIASLPGGCALQIVSGARHLMAGHEAVAADAIVRYVQRWAALDGL